MSRNIFKRQKDNRVDTAPFQFQATRFSDGPLDLEAEAELEAFNEAAPGDGGGMNYPGSGGGPGMGGGSGIDPGEIIDRAQKDADAIIAEAKQRAAVVEREAYEKGLEEGRKTGELMAEQQLQAILTHYHHGMTGLDAMRELLFNENQLEMMDLIIYLAQKVVCAELQMNPAALLPMVKEGIMSLKQRKGIVIFMNPDDHQFVMGMSEQEQQKWFGSQVQIEVDAGQGRGSYRIETSAGELDANIEAQMKLLDEKLREAWANS